MHFVKGEDSRSERYEVNVMKITQHFVDVPPRLHIALERHLPSQPLLQETICESGRTSSNVGGEGVQDPLTSTVYG